MQGKGQHLNASTNSSSEGSCISLFLDLQGGRVVLDLQQGGHEGRHWVGGGPCSAAILYHGIEAFEIIPLESSGQSLQEEWHKNSIAGTVCWGNMPCV